MAHNPIIVKRAGTYSGSCGVCGALVKAQPMRLGVELLLTDHYMREHPTEGVRSGAVPASWRGQ